MTKRVPIRVHEQRARHVAHARAEREGQRGRLELGQLLRARVRVRVGVRVRARVRARARARVRVRARARVRVRIRVRVRVRVSSCALCSCVRGARRRRSTAVRLARGSASAWLEQAPPQCTWLGVGVANPNPIPNLGSDHPVEGMLLLHLVRGDRGRQSEIEGDA